MTDDPVRSVDRVFAILNCFTLDKTRLSLTAITEDINLPATTALRVVTTLTKLAIFNKTKRAAFCLSVAAPAIRLGDPFRNLCRACRKCVPEFRNNCSSFSVRAQYKVSILTSQFWK